jgi:lysozyme
MWPLFSGDSMTPSQSCIALAQASESCRLAAYQDVKGVWTCGWGSTGKDVYFGITWTQEYADLRFQHDLSAAGHSVEALVKVPLTQGQFDALTDFVYNLGSGHLASSTLLKLLNMGNYADAGQQLLKWDIAAGEHQPGLTIRRQKELELWNGGTI